MQFPDSPDAVAALEARAETFRTPAGDGAIVWRVWGKGPPLVLLHGGHGTWRHWVRNIEALGRRHRLIVPDLPGMGDSAIVGGGTDMAPITDALARGIDLLEIGERYLLAGFSFGSLAAGYLMERHPARVAHLLLIGSGGLGPITPITGSLRRWQEEPDRLKRLEIHRHNLAALMIHDPARIDALAVAIQAHNAEHTRVNHRAAAMASNLRGCLERNPVPVTGIWGGEDALVRNHLEERRRALAALGPHARSQIVPGAGHWAQYEAPDAVNALMLAAFGTAQAPAEVGEGRG